MAKILLVDDAKNIRMLYQLELEDEGHEVITARDGHKLLDKIEREHPDLVILDVRLAEQNGLDLLAGIKGKFQGVPVILCSAYHCVNVATGPDPGVFFLEKSSDLSPLKRTVAQALRDSGPMPPTVLQL
jgi:DNA-binding NtrC family response regulator